MLSKLTLQPLRPSLQQVSFYLYRYNFCTEPFTFTCTRTLAVPWSVPQSSSNNKKFSSAWVLQVGHHKIRKVATQLSTPVKFLCNFKFAVFLLIFLCSSTVFYLIICTLVSFNYALPSALAGRSAHTLTHIYLFSIIRI